MNIAMLAPIAWRSPPRHYGPSEYVASLLTEELVSLGHDVTLYATADSQTRGVLHAICPRGYEEDPKFEPKVWETLHISELFERASAHDIIHNHLDFVPLTYSGLTTTPVVTTIHGFSSPDILPVYKKYNHKTFYVSISNADRSPVLDYIKTIHHGIDISQFDFQPVADDYLLFFGPMHKSKGARQALEIARVCNKKIILAGFIQDRDYFNHFVATYIDNKEVLFLGSLGPAERSRLLGNAYALLHPIQFDEPFSLTVIEAMACGTPVIAFNRGSMSEIIENGKSGFLVNYVQEAIDAVACIQKIDRAECRRHAQRYFTADRMTRDYLHVYEKIIKINDL